ncbi:S41 family peptidase [Occallatibacter savannae]|uniref:S41 family peptidase n=1 Tax=Occallatibacter savannae TaxID=1002691 RepID=UPI000D69875F|nr:S41 family peptidase [Occallatibacter savannae]
MLKKLSRSFLLVLWLSRLTVSTAWSEDAASSPKQTILRAADLQADVKVLQEAYTELHPGLYRYNSPAQIDAAFAELRKKLNHDQPLREAYLAFSVFAAKIRCGHTYGNFYNQPKQVVDELFSGRDRVPFYFEWNGSEMVVTRDFTGEGLLPAGTRVLKVNGTPTAAILKRLITVARADGSNDAKRVALLGVQGDDRWETFDVFYPLFFSVKEGMYVLEVRKPGESRTSTVRAGALTPEERLQPIKAREEALKGGSTEVFEWKYLDGGAAYLRMPSWALYDSKWDWNRWLGDHLDELAARHAPALIIDVRGNEGGLDVGNAILSRLINSDLKLSATRRLVRYRKVPEDLLPYLDTWDRSFRDWGESAVEMDEPWPTAPAVHYFRLKKYDDDADGDVVKPEGTHFGGRVYVLVDASNSSATFQFAQTVQQNRLGPLVGTPTGGNQRGINGGAFFFLRLPHSNIEMDLPLIGSFPSSAKPDAGLTPDVLVHTTAQDIAVHRDAGLDVVKGLIARQAAH